MLGAAQPGSEDKENKKDRIALQMLRTEQNTCTFKLRSRRPLLCSALVCHHTCGQSGGFVVVQPNSTGLPDIATPYPTLTPRMICCYIRVPLIDTIGAGLVGSEVLGLFVFRVNGKG